MEYSRYRFVEELEDAILTVTDVVGHLILTCSHISLPRNVSRPTRCSVYHTHASSWSVAFAGEQEGISITETKVAVVLVFPLTSTHIPRPHNVVS